MGFDIAHHVWADNTTPDYNSNCKFVDLYFNGVYLGNYLLIESVETGAGRVDIPADKLSAETLTKAFDSCVRMPKIETRNLLRFAVEKVVRKIEEK